MKQLFLAMGKRLEGIQESGAALSLTVGVLCLLSVVVNVFEFFQLYESGLIAENQGGIWMRVPSWFAWLSFSLYNFVRGWRQYQYEKPPKDFPKNFPMSEFLHEDDE